MRAVTFHLMGLLIAGIFANVDTVLGQQPPAAATGQSGAKPAEKPWTPKRTPDGQPDLQGYWQAQGISTGRFERALDLGNGRAGTNTETFWAYGNGWGNDQQRRIQRDLPTGVIDPPDGRVPLLPWALAMKNEIIDNGENPRTLADVDPHARCLPSGVPRTNYALGYVGNQFMQGPGHVIMYAELNHQARVIPLDDRPHLSQDIRLFLGDSRGKWSGNTLTVTTKNVRVPAATGFGWLDMQGTVYSDQLEVVEKYTLVDHDIIAFEATVSDPKVVSRPWKMAGMLVRAVEDYVVYEYACHEGNKAIINIRESIEQRSTTGR